MRSYQTEIISAIIDRRTWGGSNTMVTTTNNVTRVAYYGNVIGSISHLTKTCKVNNCGFKNASTTARINAIRHACKSLGYRIYA